MPDQQTIEQRAQEREQRRAQNAKARRAYRAKQKEKRAAARGDSPPPPPPAPKEHGPGRPKVRQGKVVSAKADKTIVVRVDVTRRHRMYKKIIRESTTLHAHDERNDANEGDLVRVIETRPMSKTKRWRHRMYKKIIRESTTLHAHDEKNDANEGDLVRVIETRPMSKTKRWRLTDVLERSR